MMQDKLAQKQQEFRQENDQSELCFHETVSFRGELMDVQERTQSLEDTRPQEFGPSVVEHVIGSPD